MPHAYSKALCDSYVVTRAELASWFFICYFVYVAFTNVELEIYCVALCSTSLYQITMKFACLLCVNNLL